MYQNAEIVHWMRHQDTHAIIPAHADIDLTNICNQDCFYCNSADFRREHPVQRSYQDYIKLLDQLAAWRSHSPQSYGSLHSLSFPGGGEPTILKNYERVLEHAIDLGFLVSLTTNGSKLENLIENVHKDKLRQFAWVGIDIDAGNELMYERIRRSLTKTSLFERVMHNARSLVDLGAKVDFKVLLNELNSTKEELESLFQLAQRINVRMLYFRPMIVNQTIFQFTPDLLSDLERLSGIYGIKYKTNQGKHLPRNYNRCHQMFQFPVFAADGKIYVCCENRGNSNFCIGSWVDSDPRDVWLSEQHHKIYRKINTHLCAPCRPNNNNRQIQACMDDPSLLENLYV